MPNTWRPNPQAVYAAALRQAQASVGKDYMAVNLQVHTPAVPKKGTLGALMGWPYSYQVVPAGAALR